MYRLSPRIEKASSDPLVPEFDKNTLNMSRSTPQITSDKPLGGRYKLISQLGVGGFGRTFLAEDLHLPGHPRCVIKHLKPQSKSDDTLQIARHYFNIEAQVLYHLGSHDQIPRLLAHFEDGQEFYLAQEFIEGEPLTREIAEGKPWSQNRVLVLIKDVLHVLTFVHQEQVIHRDLKPSNLIRRRRDRRIVLIDFGAVKQVSVPNGDPETGLTNLTISIGTQGYMSNEQLAGKPRFCSDVYAVGVLAVQMLTGVHPRHWHEDENGEIAWHDQVPQIDSEFRDVLDRMTRYDFRERYVDAAEALAALEALPELTPDPQPDYGMLPETLRLNSVSNTSTQSVTAPQNDTSTSLSGQLAKANIEFSNGREVIASDEEPISTAIWLPNDSLIQALQNDKSGMTQAVGRPLPSDVNSTGSGQPTAASRRPTQRWLIAGGLLAAGLMVGLSQVLFPQFRIQLGQNSTIPNIAGYSTASPSPVPDPEQQAALIVGEANHLLQTKQYEQALEAYDRAIGLKSDYAEAYAGRCETLNQLNRPEAAIVSCNDALDLKPDYPEALWSQGNVRLLQNRPYEALKLYEQVTELKPEFAPGWVKRGVALQQLGRSAESLDVLDQGIDLERNSFEAWITKGEALLNLQRYDLALAAIDKALQLQPQDPYAMKLRQQAKAKAKAN